MGSTIINYAARHELYSGHNPFYGVDKLPVDNDRQRYLTADEVLLLIREVSDKPMLHIFTVLSVITGARLASVLTAQVKLLHFDTGMIDLHDHKSGGNYSGFMPDEFKAALQEHVKGRKPNDYVVSPSGEQIKDVKRIQRPLKPILDRLFNEGLESGDTKHRVVVHTLRHSFGSIHANNGTPIYTIQKLCTMRISSRRPGTRSSPPMPVMTQSIMFGNAQEARDKAPDFGVDERLIGHWHLPVS